MNMKTEQLRETKKRDGVSSVPFFGSRKARHYIPGFILAGLGGYLTYDDMQAIFNPDAFAQSAEMGFLFSVPILLVGVYFILNRPGFLTMNEREERDKNFVATLSALAFGVFIGFFGAIASAEFINNAFADARSDLFAEHGYEQVEYTDTVQFIGSFPSGSVTYYEGVKDGKVYEIHLMTDKKERTMEFEAFERNSAEQDVPDNVGGKTHP